MKDVDDMGGDDANRKINGLTIFTKCHTLWMGSKRASSERGCETFDGGL